MDFALSEDQQAIAELAGQILKDKVTEQSLHALETSGKWLHEPAWQAFCEAQLPGLALPEAVGGGGLGLLELLTLLEEVGRYTAPLPLLEGILGSALAISDHGSTTQKEQWLPDMINGSAITPVALSERANPGATHLHTRGERTANGWRLSGHKTCVGFASVATGFLLPAQTPEGIGLFYVAATAVGLQMELQASTTEEPVGELHFDKLILPEDALIGAADGTAWRALLNRVTLGVCALQLGAAQRALELTATYARERKQFGVPICQFQAVAQRAADAYIHVEAMRITLRQAAWRVAQGLDATRELHVAKYWACEGGYFTVAAAQHLHGGIGFDRDYPLFRTYLLSRRNELLLGGANHHLAMLGDALADADQIADHF